MTRILGAAIAVLTAIDDFRSLSFYLATVSFTSVL
jgi:hypothetical protein